MIKNEEQALEVDPFEGDYGDSTDAVLKNKIVTIRKERPCSFCRRMIKAGRTGPQHDLQARWRDQESYFL